MSVAARGPTRPTRPVRAVQQAFGIAFHSNVPLPFTSATARANDRTTRLETASSRDLDRAWRPRGGGSRVLERRRRDGRLVMSVDYEPKLGYRVVAPRNGRHIVSPDGAKIVSALPGTAPWRWQRLLFAQVMPLAATLQGVELLHASAVELDGQAVGFVARSGTGKTSAAAHLVASGATLLTDDVLALEAADGVIVAHPGVARLSIDRRELSSMSATGRGRLGARLGTADGKDLLAVELVERPSPLGRLYFLERQASGRLLIEPLEPDPVRLLANSFNTYVRTPDRVVTQLATAARLAETTAMFRVRIPPGRSSQEVASRIVAHVRRT